MRPNSSQKITNKIRDLVHRVMYEELCLGLTEPESREAFIEIIDDLVQRGAQGVALARE